MRSSEPVKTMVLPENAVSLRRFLGFLDGQFADQRLDHLPVVRLGKIARRESTTASPISSSASISSPPPRRRGRYSTQPARRNAQSP
jgi:hypothetical protein